MLDLFQQFYHEGIATTFYLKPINFISKYVKNQLILKFLKIIVFLLYTIFAITFGIVVFLWRI